MMFLPLAVKISGLIIRHILCRQHLLIDPQCAVQPPPHHVSSLTGLCGGEEVLMLLNGLLCSLKTESLEVKGLGQNAVTVLPHTTQLMPSSVQSLEPLGQEHVLGICLTSGDLLTDIPHLLVLSTSFLIFSCWVSKLSASVTEVGMSSEATAVWVRDSQDWKSSRSLRKPCSLLASPSDSSRRFMSQHATSPYLNGLQVPLHAGEFALQCHHSSQVVAQALGGFNHFGLFLHPCLDLVTLQVVVLDVQSRLQGNFLLASQFFKLVPSTDDTRFFGAQQLLGHLVHISDTSTSFTEHAVEGQGAFQSLAASY
ncbi:hypothetical protein F7725_006706 [Dissostichus mawsoni]|uniref:Uncharacterized protein n=1 Tax=Dissostichus mawsoni TaxID=36200 RepID=A0A7J5XUN1_DISMA|nr:hypothetical protein F7725_006706 [Dissostichus mawsoni]